ncbi:MAG TPA: methylmalonyl-CoA mutase family protein, partial [Nitrososphaerales archaeon]|nr:methylmalonyl-CoA mutase family protein [Nitrososphaerales archaeon]
PSEEAVTIALRTQQIIAEESGVIETADPVGGSFYLEALTDEIEARATEELERIEKLGGALKAIKTGYIQREIQQSAYEYQKAVDEKNKFVVGVNMFVDEERQSPMLLRISNKSVQQQLSQLRKSREKRDNVACEKATSLLEEIASKRNHGDENNLVPLIIQATKAGATTGEISNVLRAAFGEYHPRTIV